MQQQQQQSYQNQQNSANNSQPFDMSGASMFVEGKHPVSHLGELAAKRKWIQPMYAEVEDTGPPHQKQFLFRVSLFCFNYCIFKLTL